MKYKKVYGGIVPNKNPSFDEIGVRIVPRGFYPYGCETILRRDYVDKHYKNNNLFQFPDTIIIKLNLK